MLSRRQAESIRRIGQDLGLQARNALASQTAAGRSIPVCIPSHRLGDCRGRRMDRLRQGSGSDDHTGDFQLSVRASPQRRSFSDM